MLNLSNYPIALQLLMQTDGTVTDLIRLLSGEDIGVIKIQEKKNSTDEKAILHRRIYLQGKQSKKNWVYAESEIYLENLSQDFIHDLIERTIPIGTLWLKYRIETFKDMIAQYQETTQDDEIFARGEELLVRVYRVFHQQKCIMKITEKFPVARLQALSNCLKQ